MIEHTSSNNHHEIRDAIRALCAQFPDEYFRKIDEQRVYPEAFVNALTQAGWLAALIPQEYGGSGLGLTEASVIMEEINRCGGNSGACHGQMYNMGTLLRHGSKEQKEKYLPKITDDDMKLISEPIDIYGQNIYNGQCIRMGKDGHPEYVRRYEGFPKTAINWPVTPECLNWGPRFLYERYKTPIYITENGMSCHDVVSLDGKVHDPNRIDFLARYLDELKKAATVADIRGYFQWSLMDNFEWSKGYSERFGLIYIDYQTQQRILKDSAYWYKDYIKNNGEF